VGLQLGDTTKTSGTPQALALTPSLLGRSTLFLCNTTAGPVHAGPARGWERFQNGGTCKTCILQFYCSALHSAEPHRAVRQGVPLDVSTPCTEAVNVPLTPSLGSGRLSSCIAASSVPLATNQLQTNASDIVVPCWRVLPLGLGAASNVANLQGYAGIASGYSSNKYPQTSTTNAQRHDKGFHSRLSLALTASLFTQYQLSIKSDSI
jgi:hypothetical protein